MLVILVDGIKEKKIFGEKKINFSGNITNSSINNFTTRMKDREDNQIQEDQIRICMVFVKFMAVTIILLWIVFTDSLKILVMKMQLSHIM